MAVCVRYPFTWLRFQEAKEAALRRFEAAYFAQLWAHHKGNIAAMADEARAPREHVIEYLRRYRIGGYER